LKTADEETMFGGLRFPAFAKKPAGMGDGVDIVRTFENGSGHD
jgi:hypothetical protein